MVPTAALTCLRRGARSTCSVTDRRHGRHRCCNINAIRAVDRRTLPVVGPHRGNRGVRERGFILRSKRGIGIVGALAIEWRPARRRSVRLSPGEEQRGWRGTVRRPRPARRSRRAWSPTPVASTTSRSTPPRGPVCRPRNKQNSNITVQYVASTTEADYEPNLTNFANQKCDLILAVGGLMGGDDRQGRHGQPERAVRDRRLRAAPAKNVYSMQFDTAQAGYLAGLPRRRHDARPARSAPTAA